MSTGPITPQPLNDLVARVRKQYPGVYDDMDDATLTQKLLAKYPQYSDLAAPKLTVGAPSQSPLATLKNPSGEGPIAQALTTMETNFANMPSAILHRLQPRSANNPTGVPVNLDGSPHEMTPDEFRKAGGELGTLKSFAKSLNPIDTQEGNTAMNIGGTATNLLPLVLDLGGGGIAESPVGKLTTSITQPLKKFTLAPSDPDALYQSYLKPIAGAPVPVPKAPLPVMSSVLRDMEAAGEGDAADRIQSGKATVGDLDLMRQRANRLARSIYRSPGNYSPGMAEGADQLASDIRSQTYPLIESSQGLPAGSVSKIKTLQGKVMESQRNPTFTNQLVKKGIGSTAGALSVYGMGGGPGGAALGAIAGERLAGPLADAADRAITGLRTKALAYKLPEPGLVRRFALPPSRMMPPVESAPGAPDFTEFTNPFTTQQLKNFILPEKSGAPIILDGTDEMTPGEKVAAQDFNLRKKRVLQLPEKGSPILLPSGQ